MLAEDNFQTKNESLLKIVAAFDQISELTKNIHEDHIEWRGHQSGNFPTKTHIMLDMNHPRGLVTLTARCCFGYLNKTDIPKEIFEILNSKLDDKPLMPVRFCVTNDPKQENFWLCFVEYSGVEKYLSPESIADVYFHLVLVAVEAIQLLKQADCRNFFLIPEKTLNDEGS